LAQAFFAQGLIRRRLLMSSRGSLPPPVTSNVRERGLRVAVVLAGLMSATAVSMLNRASSSFAPRVWPSAARLGRGCGQELGEALRHDGFVRVEAEPAELAIFDRALEDFADARAFRFPPPAHESNREPGAMPAAFSHCFSALYAVAVAAAFALSGARGRSLPPPPCSSSGSGLPFEGEGGPWPYSASFFNIFNYNHGCLNTHRDRGVLTVVYGARNTSTVAGSAPATRLWLQARGPSGPRWVSPDEGQLLLWAGDGLKLPGVEAVEHCVRVDPRGPYIEHSHARRDPAAPLQGNRRSVALVLDE